MREGQKYKGCVIKRKGHTEEFDERKLYGSIYAACASAHLGELVCEKTADDISKKVKKWIKGKKSVDSLKIREKVTAELKKKDEELAFFYEHHLPDLTRL